MKITLIGAGVRPGDLSARAYEAAKNADKLFVRTALSEVGKWLTETFPEAEALDGLYEKSRNFDTLSTNLAKAVTSAAKENSVCLLVDGSPEEDEACRKIIEKRRDAEVIEGISKTQSALSAARFCADGIFSVSAYCAENVTSLPCVIYDLDNQFTAGKAKLLLAEKFGDEIECFKVYRGQARKIKLYELDRDDEFDYSTALVVPKPKLTEKSRFDFSDLMEILRILRSENGCPWDKVQTPESLRKNVLEETYELLDAIDKGDDDAICEELGDFILQAAFQCIFAEETRSFTRSDVFSGICNKLIARHTHVFGEDAAKTSAEALDLWAENKQKEKGYTSGAEYLEAVPPSFPALLRAEKVGSRSGKYNMDFANADDALKKLYEEIDEVVAAVKSGNAKDVEEECGDLLFAAVSFIRLTGVECELSLQAATEKFIRRFKKAEQLALKDGKNLKDITPEEVNSYYDAAKKN